MTMNKEKKDEVISVRKCYREVEAILSLELKWPDGMQNLGDDQIDRHIKIVLEQEFAYLLQDKCETLLKIKPVAVLIRGSKRISWADYGI